MIVLGMAGKVLAGAVGAVSIAAGAARHLAWYIGYRVDGTGARLGAASVAASESSSRRRTRR